MYGSVSASIWQLVWQLVVRRAGKGRAGNGVERLMLTIRLLSQVVARD